jgi:TIR domain-containing protein
VPDFDRQQTVLFYRRGTRVEVHDGDVPAFLGELRRRVGDAGASPTAGPIGPRPRVFVSYASEDSGLASRLFASLQNSGFAPWLDRDALRGGELWNEAIEDHLRDAEYVLVLETMSLARKLVGYVNKEIAIARDQAQRYRGSFLIPLLAEGMTPGDQLQELSAFQHVPLRESHYDDDIAALVSLMRRDYQRRQRQLT